jgi:hypothetical protein
LGKLSTERNKEKIWLQVVAKPFACASLKRKGKVLQQPLISSWPPAFFIRAEILDLHQSALRGSSLAQATKTLEARITQAKTSLKTEKA